MAQLSLVFQDGPPPVTAAQMNSLVAAINAADLSITNINTSITQLRLEYVDAFKVSIGSGLTANYNGGTIRLSDGSATTISAGSIVLPDNNISYVYVEEYLSGSTLMARVAQGASYPAVSLPMAKVTTSAGAITEVINEPKIKINLNPDRRVFAATKSSQMNIPSNNLAYGIPGWSANPSNSSFDVNSGVWTVPTTDFYRIDAKTLMICDVVAALNAKLWINSSVAGEIATAGEVSAIVSANATRFTLNGWFEGTLTAGTQITLQVQSTAGNNVRILGDANTQFIVRRGAY